MAQCKQTAQEFIQDTFSPLVAVLCSHDAELVCKKNNLSFVELTQPFCRLNTEAHMRDPSNMSHTIRNMKITMRDMNSHPPVQGMAKKMMHDAVLNALPSVDNSRTNVITVGDYDLQLSGTTPWFEAYRESFLQVTEASDHEFMKHYLGCVFVVSSSHADPMEQFSKLTQQQHQQQHNQPSKSIRWFCPNVLRYYVLIHDVLEEEEAKAEAIYQSMKSTYGLSSCHLLHINSRSKNAPENVKNEHTNLPDPWSQFLNKKPDYNDAADFDSGGQDTEDIGSLTSRVNEGTSDLMPPEVNVDSAVEATEDGEVQPQSSLVIDHPLAPDAPDSGGMTSSGGVDNMLLRDSQNNPLSMGGAGGDRGKEPQHGNCLTLSDHDRLRIFIHEFLVRGLIPWAEKTLKTLNEQVTTRKGIHKSIFNMPKKWFGGNKPSGQSLMLEKANVVYTMEAPEMQLRRLGDLAFMFQLFELAYTTYHTAKRDFNNDHAWLHYAGALEMACMAVFMQGSSSQRQYPTHYMDSAVSTYFSYCKSPQFATRATLLSTEALKSKNMFAEAAMQFIKMTSENSEKSLFVTVKDRTGMNSTDQESDLRSALLLEQAAHCFIKMRQPMVRKYAFHMILAGHRFSKSGQRRHALRSYSQALQVYKGKNWTLAEDHINFTLGRQSFNVKQLDNATAAFKHLLTRGSQQSAPQQSAFLREYLFVYKQQMSQMPPDSPTGTLGELPQLPLPVVDGNETKVLCCQLPLQEKPGRTPASSATLYSDEDNSSHWQKLEELILVSKEGVIPGWFRPSIQCYTNRTQNSYNPVAVVGETVTVQVCLENPLKIPLVLSHTFLLWKFLPVQFGEETNQEKLPQLINNEADTVKNKLADMIVSTQVLSEVVLEGCEKKLVDLSLTAHQTGELHITGVAYHLGTSTTNQQVPTNPVTLNTNIPSITSNKPSFVSGITVLGKVTLDVQGPRLNSKMEEKAGKMYGPDRRLDLVIAPAMPLLEVTFCDLPKSLLCGEVRQVNVELSNSGNIPLQQLKVATTNPEFFTFGSQKGGPNSLDNSNIYQTVIPSSDSNSEEFVVHNGKVEYVLDVPVPGGQIAPGATVTLDMWIQGPSSHGLHNINFLFCYESMQPNSHLKHRVLRHTAVIHVQPSLVLKSSAARVGSPVSSGDKTEKQLSDLVVTLEIENISTGQDVSVQEFNILQVSCASCRWRLQHMSTRRYSDIKIGSHESTLICLRANRCRHQTETKSRGTVFTNVTFDQHQIDSSSTPCSDFYFRSDVTPKFSDLEVEQPNPVIIPKARPKPDQPLASLEKALVVDLTLIVLWKATVMNTTSESETSVITGQHHVTIDVLNSTVCAPPLLKAPVEQPPVKIIRELSTVASTAPSQELTSRLVKYSLRYKQKINHNFGKNKLCMVPIHVEMYNCSQTDLQIDIDTQADSSSGDSHKQVGTGFPSLFQDKPSSVFTWVGQNHVTTTVTSDSKHVVSLRACFWKPGVYNLGSLMVHAGVAGAETEAKTETETGTEAGAGSTAETSTGNALIQDKVLQKPAAPSLIVISDSVTEKSPTSAAAAVS